MLSLRLWSKLLILRKIKMLLWFESCYYSKPKEVEEGNILRLHSLHIIFVILELSQHSLLFHPHSDEHSGTHHQHIQDLVDCIHSVGENEQGEHATLKRMSYPSIHTVYLQSSHFSSIVGRIDNWLSIEDFVHFVRHQYLISKLHFRSCQEEDSQCSQRIADVLGNGEDVVVGWLQVGVDQPEDETANDVVEISFVKDKKLYLSENG